MKIKPAAVLLFLLVSNALSFTLSDSPVNNEIYEPKEFVGKQSLGGFPSKIGLQFGSDKANTLINLINNASALYRDDVKQNLIYIQSRMAEAYGSKDLLFGLVIQGNSTSSRTDSFVYGDANSATFAPGVNLINPSWSYLAYFYPNQGQNLQMITQLGQGKGINSTLADYINQMVKDEDGVGTVCNCVNLLIISSQIEWQYRYGWDLVCHATPDNFAYVPVKNQQWMLTKPGPCYYLIYVT